MNNDNTNKTTTSQQLVEDANRRGYYGIGLFHHKSDVNLGTLWRSASCLGASFIFTIGKRYRKQSSDVLKTFKHIPLYNYADFEEFKANGIPSGCQLIGIEMSEISRPIGNFVHPERAVYLLGAEDHGLPMSVQEECVSVLELPGIMCLNVATTGSIVMYDKINKS